MPNQQQRINRAVRECFEYACESSSIVTGIAKFIAELRTSGEWQESEIHAVEFSVHHLFSGVVDGAMSSEDEPHAFVSNSDHLIR